MMTRFDTMLSPKPEGQAKPRGTRLAWWSIFTASLYLTACSSGVDDRRTCVTSSDCPGDQVCSDGICGESCTPGVDCPEDVTGDGSTTDTSVTDTGPTDAGPDANADTSPDTTTPSDTSGEQDTESDTGPEVIGPGELASCGLGRSVQASEDGTSFEVQFGKAKSGFIAVPGGWNLSNTCCLAGCCQ